MKRYLVTGKSISLLGAMTIYVLFICVNSLYSSETVGTSDMETLKPVTIPSGELKMSVNPQIELLTIIQYLAASNMVCKDNYGYADSVQAWFAPFKAHPVLQQFHDFEKKGFSYDLPVEYIMLFEGVPLLNRDKALPSYLLRMHNERIQAIGSETDFESLISNINDFVAKSHFDQFFAKQEGFYKNQLSRVDSLLKDSGFVETLENWYGYKQNSYNLIIAPLQDGGYGPCFTNKSGGNDLYCLTALPSDKDESIVLQQLAAMIFHEFSHSYVNPLVEEYYPRLKKAGNLHKLIKQQMENQAYELWWTVLAEHFVRASSIRMEQKNSVAVSLNFNKDRDKQQGFIYIDFILDGLKEYETEHSKFGINYNDYFPVLVKSMLKLSRHPDKYIQADKVFTGHLGTVVSYNPIIIIPDPENNPDVNKYIMPTVDWLTTHTGATYITDTRALKVSLKDYYLVVYGTPESNKWLKKHIKMLPFKILPDKIIADKVYIGTDLRIISCLPNPDNPRLGVAIYSAQTMQAMKGSNNVEHGSEDYVISDSTSEHNILGKGDYDRTGKIWKFKEKQ